MRAEKKSPDPRGFRHFRPPGRSFQTKCSNVVEGGKVEGVERAEKVVGEGGNREREREREDGWKRGSERKRRRGGRGGGEGGGGVGGERGRRVSERYVNYVKWLYTSVVVLCRW